MREYEKVRVERVVEETPDAISLVLAGDLAYRAGQFLTVRVPCGTRCYSLASAPETGEAPKITVKRMAGGAVSNWICDHVAAGTELEVLPPAGRFTPASVDEDLLLLAAGSGITPVMSIVKSVLHRGRGHLALVYANRDERSVIFAAELRELAEHHPGRLTVRHWFDTHRGPPSVQDLQNLIFGYAQREAFICGPEPFLDAATEALAGVPAERIHIERFETAVSIVDVNETGSTAVVELDGQTHHLPWPATSRLLDVLIAAGLNPPYSCRQGNCGACACRVLAGEVELVHNEVLEDEDFAEGYILACQALPRSDEVRVTYS